MSARSYVLGRAVPAVAAAVAANVAAYLLLDLLVDQGLRVARAGEPVMDLGLGPVVSVTLVPAFIAAASATALRDRPRRLRQLVVAGWVVAVLSLAAVVVLPVAVEGRLGLAVLHLLPAAILLPWLTRRSTDG